MIVRFNSKYLEELYRGKPKGKPRFHPDVAKKYYKVIRILEAANSLHDLKQFRNLNFEALKGDIAEIYSVHVDKQYRLIISVTEDGIQLEKVILVEDLTNHYQ